MSEFVEQCRQEWRRLGVPDQLADEMAADLSADLSEAEAEGVTAEQVLGDSVHDPRSFAASWAAERGVIPEPPSPSRLRRRPLILTAFTALSGIMLLVAVLLLLTGNPKVSLVTNGARRGSAGSIVTSQHVVTSPNVSAPVEWILLVLALAALGFAAWLWRGWSRSGPLAAA
jgi:hypothetical protein